MGIGRIFFWQVYFRFDFHGWFVTDESLGDVVELLKNLVGFDMYGLPVMTEVCCGKKNCFPFRPDCENVRVLGFNFWDLVIYNNLLAYIQLLLVNILLTCFKVQVNLICI
jgi:hypothetical protein